MAQRLTIRATVAVACLLLGFAISNWASAQNATTSCFVSGQWVNCDITTAPSAPSGPTDYLKAMHVLPDFYGSFQQGQQEAAQLQQQRLQNEAMAAQLAQQRQQARQRQLQESYANAQAAIRQDVINKVRAGDCPGAIDLALAAGDIEFATKTKAFCATGDTPKPQP